MQTVELCGNNFKGNIFTIISDRFSIKIFNSKVSGVMKTS